MLKRKFLIVAIALFLVVGIYVASLFFKTTEYRTCGCQLPPRIIWQVQKDQTFVQDANGTFALKYISLKPDVFRFFYALRTPHTGIPTANVLGYPPQKPQAPIRLPATIHSLGQLGDFSLGYVEIAHYNSVGETLSLQVNLPGQEQPAWTLAFLKQVAAEEKAGPVLGYENLDYAYLPEIQFTGRVYAVSYKATYGFFRLNPSQSTPRYTFLRMNDSGSVVVITEKDYVSAAGNTYLTPESQK